MTDYTPTKSDILKSAAIERMAVQWVADLPPNNSRQALVILSRLFVDRAEVFERIAKDMNDD
jgi:hypothetical protein